MKTNKPKTVQKSVTERPRGSQTKKRHAHTNGQNHAQLVVLWNCELLICSRTKNESNSRKLSWQRNQTDNIFSQNKCTFPLNFHKTAHGPNTFGESAWLTSMIYSSASGINSQGNMFLLL